MDSILTISAEFGIGSVTRHLGSSMARINKTLDDIKAKYGVAE